MVLGQLVSAWRKEHRKSLRQLANLIGVDHRAIDRLEHGKDIRCRALALIFCWMLEK